MGALNVLTPTLRPRATENVPAMVAVIEKLIAKGAAYVVPSGVYFSVAADEDYGKLSGRNQDDLKAGARVDGEDDKRSPSDFALWKTSKPGEPSWDAPFGAGRPGWHIECSAMIEEELGSPIDIHGGGIDLIFPHHENEIAQSECAHGRPLARVWMHNGFLTMDKEKMSKSIGNIITPRELLEQGWQGETIRWALLSAHYRTPLDWSDDLLEQSQRSLDRMYGAVLRLKDAASVEAEAPAAFVAALADDLNTPAAVAELSALVTTANNAKKPADQSKAKAELLAAAALLGVLQSDPEEWFRVRLGDRALEVDALVAKRDAARKEKDWSLADKLRKEIEGYWASVQDTAAGGRWQSAISEQSLEHSVQEWVASTSGGAIEKDVPIGDMSADMLVADGDKFILIETKLSIRDVTELAKQASVLVQAATDSGREISKVVIVAPNTSSNNTAILSTTYVPPISTASFIISTVSGNGEEELHVEIGPDGKVRL